MSENLGQDNPLEGWIKEQYDLNAGALRELGFEQPAVDRLFPTAEVIVGSVSADEAGFLVDRLNAGLADRLLISPAVHRIGLKVPGGLLSRFDTKQVDGKKTFVEAISWGRTVDGGVIHDNNREWPPFQVGVLLADTDESNPDSLEPDLVYTNLNVDAQRASLEEEQKQFADKNLRLQAATIGQVVVANAQLRMAGCDWLDSQGTATRFIQYKLEPGPMGTPPYTVNTAHAKDNRLWLVSSIATLSKVNEGVRRVLSLKVNTSEQVEADISKRKNSKGLIRGVDLSKRRIR